MNVANTPYGWPFVTSFRGSTGEPSQRLCPCYFQLTATVAFTNQPFTIDKAGLVGWFAPAEVERSGRTAEPPTEGAETQQKSQKPQSNFEPISHT